MEGRMERGEGRKEKWGVETKKERDKERRVER